MTAPASAPAPAKRGIPRTVWDLVFTLLIPIAVLSPDLLGSGFSVAETVFGGGVTGNIRAYLLAALIPVAYVAYDLLVNRNVSPIAIFGGSFAVIRGALAFWYVDGWQYAFKDSLPNLLLALFAFASLATRIPLLRVLLDASAVAESPENRARLGAALRDPAVLGGLKAGTLAYGGAEVVATAVNYVVNLRIVVAPFADSAFNAQIAQANAVMRVPSLIISLVGIALGIYFVQRAVRGRFGKRASVFSPETLPETPARP